MSVSKDDTLVTWSSTSRIDDITIGFNYAHHWIAFTCEVKEYSSISFLDVHLTGRPDGGTSHAVYQKPTWVGQCLHFQSFMPLRYKRNSITCLVSTTERICIPGCPINKGNYTIHCEKMGTQVDIYLKIWTIKFKQVFRGYVHKPVYLKLRFKWEIIEEKITHKLRTTITRLFRAAQICTAFSTSLFCFRVSTKNGLVQPPPCVFADSTAPVEQVIKVVRRDIFQKRWLNTIEPLNLSIFWRNEKDRNQLI